MTNSLRTSRGPV